MAESSLDLVVGRASEQEVRRYQDSLESQSYGFFKALTAFRGALEKAIEIARLSFPDRPSPGPGRPEIADILIASIRNQG